MLCVLVGICHSPEITVTAGHDINSTTDTLTAKKDMTQDGDNYLRTYHQTELGTTIEAGGNVSIDNLCA